MGVFLLASALSLMLQAQPAERPRAEALAQRATDRLQALQKEADRLAADERTLLGDLRKLEVDRQIKAGLDGLTGDQIGALVIAYEPVWAIGTGRNATPQQAGEAHAHIRSRVRQWFGAPAADHCHVIYGGSVKPDNIHDLVLLPDVDGALVGGASLDVKGFYDIVARSRPSAV